MDHHFVKYVNSSYQHVMTADYVKNVGIIVRNVMMSKPLQELLDEAALAVQPVLDELLKEIEEGDGD